MTTKSDANLEQKLTLCSKNDKKNLVNFHPTTQKSKNFSSMGYFCPKYIRFGLRKFRGIIFHDAQQWCKIWLNPDLVVSNMARGIRWSFIRPPKVWKLVHWWVFLSKAYNVSARKYYVSWHWRMIQNLKKADLWLEKWLKEFG